MVVFGGTVFRFRKSRCVAYFVLMECLDHPGSPISVVRVSSEGERAAGVRVDNLQNTTTFVLSFLLIFTALLDAA